MYNAQFEVPNESQISNEVYKNAPPTPTLSDIKHSGNNMANTLYNSRLFRFAVLVMFFTIIYDIPISIFKFFDVEQTNVITYMAWITLLLILWAFLPQDASVFYQLHGRPLVTHQKYAYYLYYLFVSLFLGITLFQLA